MNQLTLDGKKVTKKKRKGVCCLREGTQIYWFRLMEREKNTEVKKE